VSDTSFFATITWSRPAYDGGGELQGFILQQARYFPANGGTPLDDTQLAWSNLPVGPLFNGRVLATTLSVGPVGLNRAQSSFNSDKGVAVRVIAVNAYGQTAGLSYRIRDPYSL
jgi:hypothetical protein